jgi:hypothetical protein
MFSSPVIGWWALRLFLFLTIVIGATKDIEIQTTSWDSNFISFGSHDDFICNALRSVHSVFHMNMPIFHHQQCAVIPFSILSHHTYYICLGWTTRVYQYTIQINWYFRTLMSIKKNIVDFHSPLWKEY